MNPVMFDFGFIQIRWYSFFILMGIVVGYLIAFIEFLRKKDSLDFLLDLVFYIVVAGIFGARIYYVLFNFGYYSSHIGEIFKVWNGGLAIHGGIIAGFIALVILCKKKNRSIMQTLDYVAPSLIIAQCIGRWGNFFNQEAHGPLTTLEQLKSLKFIPNFIINGMKINGLYFHPTFYYESIWCFIGFVVIMVLKFVMEILSNKGKVRKLRNGLLACVYLMWYSVGRFFIESLRTDSLMILNFKVAQIISCLLFIIGLVGAILIIIKSDDK